MTKEEFLARLRETPRDWRIGLHGEIRRGPHSPALCPIMALLPGSGLSWFAVAKQVGLPVKLGSAIVAASDQEAAETNCYAKSLRAEILEAVGLSSEAQE